MNHDAEPSTTKRAYTDLADYAAEHHAPEEAYRRKGWYDTSHNRRPALAIPTDSGERYRYIDGRGSYINVSGYKPCLYGLSEALEIHDQTGLSLVFCNGEASTVTAQHYGLPAFTHTAGEGTKLTEEQLKRLQAAYRGPVIVALDSDPAGREGAAKMVLQLQGAGYDAHAVDLGGHDGCDLADFAGQHQHDAAVALASCPVLQVEAPLRGQVDQPTPQPTGPKTPLESEQEAYALELYVKSAIRGEAAALATTRSGRNNQLNNGALALGSLVGADWVQCHWIDEPEAYRALHEACIANGYIDEEGENAVRATFRSGFKAGLARPREKPSRRELTRDSRLSQRFAAAVEEQPEPGTVVPVEAISSENEKNLSHTEAPIVSAIAELSPASVAIAGSADCAGLVALLQAELERVKEAAAAREAYLTEAIEANDRRIDKLEAERGEVQAILHNPQYDFKTRVTAACIRLDPNYQEQPSGARVMAAASYERLSERYNISVSSLQNAIKPLKTAGVLEHEPRIETRGRDGKLLDHPITADVTLTYTPGELVYEGELLASKRTMANRKRSQKIRELAAIGEAAQAAECPVCKETGCMELYCSSHGVVIPHSVVEQADHPLDLTEALERGNGQLDHAGDEDVPEVTRSPETVKLTTQRLKTGGQLDHATEPDTAASHNDPDPHNTEQGKACLMDGDLKGARYFFNLVTDTRQRRALLQKVKDQELNSFHRGMLTASMAAATAAD